MGRIPIDGAVFSEIEVVDFVREIDLAAWVAAYEDQFHIGNPIGGIRGS